MAERVRDLQHQRDETREPAAVHRGGETRKHRGDGAVAHHRLPREGAATCWTHSVIPLLPVYMDDAPLQVWGRGRVLIGRADATCSRLPGENKLRSQSGYVLILIITADEEKGRILANQSQRLV